MRCPDGAHVEETTPRNLILVAHVRDVQRQITQISQPNTTSLMSLKHVLEGQASPGFTRPSG
jgi:hypothetical protein